MADTGLRIFEPGPIHIREDRLLRMQGYKAPDAVRRVIRKAAAAAARLAEELAEPRLYHLQWNVHRCQGELLELEGGHCFHCGAFPRYLSGCERIIAFILTLGQPFDDRIEQMLEADDLLGVLFLDNAGWLAIEATSKYFVQSLKSTFDTPGQRLTRRLGPGYSYRSNKVVSEWALTEQAELFELFDGHSIAVRLLESCAMLPRMSRSGIYGIRALAKET